MSFPKQYGVSNEFSRLQDSLQNIVDRLRNAEDKIRTLESANTALTQRVADLESA